jgi:hypothetical protein
MQALVLNSAARKQNPSTSTEFKRCAHVAQTISYRLKVDIEVDSTMDDVPVQCGGTTLVTESPRLRQLKSERGLQLIESTCCLDENTLSSLNLRTPMCDCADRSSHHPISLGGSLQYPQDMVMSSLTSP